MSAKILERICGSHEAGRILGVQDRRVRQIIAAKGIEARKIDERFFVMLRCDVERLARARQAARRKR